MSQPQRKTHTLQDIEDHNFSTLQIGILHLPIHSQLMLNQLQAEIDTIQYFEEPILFSKFIKMTNLLYTRKNLKDVTPEEAIHHPKPSKGTYDQPEVEIKNQRSILAPIQTEIICPHTWTNHTSPKAWDQPEVSASETVTAGYPTG